MAALVLRGFLQRKLRVLLTAVAIALGVALMAGTYILTDTINHSFAAIFTEAGKNHDVVVTARRNARARNGPSRRSPKRRSRRCARCPGSRRPRAASSAGPRCWTPSGKRLTTGGAPGLRRRRAAGAL